jgi:predicted nucleic acid-binding Zn ribbon protein
MGRSSDQPQHLADVLRTMAKRVKKVDLTLIEEIRRYWPTIVDANLATTCQPEFVKNGVLVISVPSGAFAQQIIIEQDVILSGLAVLGERTPTSVKTIQKA